MYRPRYVRFDELGTRPQIEQRGPHLEVRDRILDRQRVRSRLTERCGALAVRGLDALVIAWLFGQLAGCVGDELLAPPRRQCGVEPPLETHRRAAHRPDGPATQRASPMPRIHHHHIIQPEQVVEQAGIQIIRQATRRFFPHQVGPADVTHEERVTGHDHPRLRCACRVADQQADTFRGVARCVTYVEPHVAQPEGVAPLERLVGKAGAARLVQVDGRSGPFGQVGVARHVIGVQVGLDDVGDFQTPRGRGIEIHLHIPIRIDHRCHALALTTNQIRRTTQPIDEKLLRIHVSFPRLILCLCGQIGSDK